MHKWNINFYMKTGDVILADVDSNNTNSNDCIVEIFKESKQDTWIGFRLRENHKKTVYIQLANVSHYEIFE